MQRCFLLTRTNVCWCACCVCRAQKKKRRKIEREKRKQRALDGWGGFFNLAGRGEKQNVVKERERRRGWEVCRRIQEPEESFQSNTMSGGDEHLSLRCISFNTHFCCRSITEDNNFDRWTLCYWCAAWTVVSFWSGSFTMCCSLTWAQLESTCIWEVDSCGTRHPSWLLLKHGCQWIRIFNCS